MSDAVSPLSLFTTSVNFVLGAGVLGIPHAVASAGIAASALALMLVCGLSMLTSSWLIEVGDRANALQNELASGVLKEIQHADGGSSMLSPAEGFMKLKEPLLSKASPAVKLDEYRAAYRSWRTGSASGARDSQLKKLMPLLTYEEGRHRGLLPLQLLPPQLLPPWASAHVRVPIAPSDARPILGEESSSDLGSDMGRATRSATCSGATTPLESLDWLPITSLDDHTRSLDDHIRSLDDHTRSLDGHTSGGATPDRPKIKRMDSFSADLHAALLQLPTADEEADEEANDGIYSPPTPSLPKPVADALPPPRPRRRRESSRRVRRPNWSMPAAVGISALEVAQLCTLFLGWRARALWLASILALHVSAMWACCAVWITCAHAAMVSCAIALPGWLTPTMLLAPCAAVLLPLSTLGGTEAIQPVLAAATLGTLGGMCILLLWALAMRGGDDAYEVFQPTHAPPAAAVFDGAHFGAALANFLFAYIVQQSVPTLIRRAKEPRHTRTAVLAAIGTCCTLYLVLGVAAALLFGAATQPLITLNFETLRAAPPGAPPAVWARLVSHWVMLLPIITTTAAFPLFNRVLAANLEALLPAPLRSRRLSAGLCATPPLVLTACVRDPSVVFSVAGLAGFTIVWFVPAMLQHAAMRASVNRWGELGRATPHTTCLSGPETVGVVMLAGVVAFAYNLWALVLG